MKNTQPDRPANRRLLANFAVLTFLFVAALMLPAVQTAAQDVPPPTTQPDAVNGLEIYNQRCAVCHGELGDGQGPQALQAGLEPTTLADPAYRITAVPTNMFESISNGNLAAGMPPFGSASSNPLSDAEIWDLVALAYSFSTRPADIAAGEALATELEADISTWPGLEYWFSRSNEAILAELAGDDLLGVDLTGLSDAEKLSLVDYGRSLHYIYTDPLAAAAPVPLATIGGQVLNGTTGESVTQGEVRLRAFTVELQEMYSATVPINEDGTFEFQVENASAEWVFLGDVVYGDLVFNSNAVQVSTQQPAAQIPVFVFDTTTDASAISIDRLHIILTFAPDRLMVSELYLVSNQATTVFIGKHGDLDQGTVEIGLPAGAENIDFQRGFSTSFDSFIPANDIIQTDTGWADTVPLRPGSGSLNLLVSYELPYEDGLLLAHPLAYPISGGASVIMADADVTITDAGWVSQGEQTGASGTFVSYLNTNLADADSISLTLDGRPSQIVDTQGNVLPARNETNELVVGGVALAAMLVAGFFLVQHWRTAPVEDDPALATAQSAAAAPAAPKSTRHDANKAALLQAIADLDSAYELGELAEEDYEAKRQELKRLLTAVWNQSPDHV